MACEINLGGNINVHPDKIAVALKAVEGISDFELAVVRGYAELKEDVPLAAWERYLEKVWETVPKSRKITEEDIFGEDIATDDVVELKNLLNLDKQTFETARGDIRTGLSPETVIAIGQWKKHLIAKEDVLDAQEVQRVLRALKSIVELGKREARLEQMRTASIRNIRKKIGSHESFPVFDALLRPTTRVLKKFTGETAEYSKATMLEDYREILEALSARKKMVDYTLGELQELTEKAQKIISALGEYEVEVKQVKLESQEERESAIAKLLSSKSDENKLRIREERDKVRFINELTQSDMEALENSDILDLIKGKIGINNGIYQLNLTKIIEKVIKHRQVVEAKKVFNNTEKLHILANAWSRSAAWLSKVFHGSKHEIFYYLLRTRNSSYTGTVFGDKKNLLYKEILRPAEIASEKVSVHRSGLYTRHDKVSDKLGVGRKRIENIYKTSILAFADMYDTNQDQWSPESLIDSFINNGRNSDYVNIATVEVVQKLKDQYVVDGKLNRTKLKADVLADKGAKALYEFNQDNGNEMAPYLLVSTTERGEAVPILNNHAAIRTLWTPSAGSINPDEKFVNSIHPSTKSSSSHEKIKADPTKVAPVVDFDLLTASTSSAAEIITDYHMRAPLAAAWNSSNEALESLVSEKADNLSISAARGWKQHVHNEIRQHLSRQAEPYSWLEEAKKLAIKGVYVAKLARKDKFVSEIAGQMSWWGINHPVLWAKGAKSDAIFRKDFGAILNNIGSTQTIKTTKAGTWAGKNVDQAILHSSIKRGRNKATKGDNIKGIAQQAGKVIGKAGSITDYASSEVLSLPDRSTNRPGYIGSLEDKFKKLTGIQLTNAEYDLISNNDEAFMTKHKDALNESARFADEINVRAASTANTLASASRFKKEEGDSAQAQFVKAASGYLMNFTINEGASWKYYFRGLLAREEITRAEAVKGMTAVLIRMALYRPIMTAATIAFAMAGVGDDDDETMADVFRQFKRDLIGSLLTVSIQGTQGSVQRELTSQLMEAVNEEYFTELRDGEEYNEYQHGIVFKLLRERDLGPRSKVSDVIVKNSGAFGQMIKETQKFKDAYYDKKISKEEYAEDVAIAIMGYVFRAPGYSDVMKGRRQERYEAKQQAKKKKSTRKSTPSRSTRPKRATRPKRESRK